MTGPLDGVRVLDLSAIISGPFCCQMLADQGAEVIKIEPRVIGDLTRVAGFRVGSISSLFGSVNRGKRSVSIDLAKPEGVEVVKRLAATVDVVVQNFRPGAVERMGIGPADLRAVNPDLIYVSISGFGPTGPYSAWRVYDPIIQCVTGVVSTQQSQDIPIPDLVRTLICDKATAQTAAQAITAALFARATGKARGQHLVVPMLDSSMYWLWPDTFMGASFMSDHVTPGVTLSQVYRVQPTADGHLVYFAASDAETRGLCNALGIGHLMDDPRFATPQARQTGGNFEALGEILNNAFLEQRTDEILKKLHEHEVPAASVNDLTSVFSDPQVVHNGVVHTWEHETVGTIRQARPPVRWSDTAHEPVWSLDELGQSTVDVLSANGWDADGIEALRTAGVIA
jgi:crotonobetainyl-CoA:carnitine CoA-transferase CaiB-like acyl-CoA transferase